MRQHRFPGDGERGTISDRVQPLTGTEPMRHGDTGSGAVHRRRRARVRVPLLARPALETQAAG